MPKNDDAQKPASASPQMPAPPAPPDRQPAPAGQESPSALDKQAEKLAEQAAAEQAKADELAAKAQKAAEAAEDEDAPGTVRRCPHCRAPMERHDDSNPHKARCWHCSMCGTCWAPGLKHPRIGTPAPAGWKE